MALCFNNGYNVRSVCGGDKHDKENCAVGSLGEKVHDEIKRQTI